MAADLDEILPHRFPFALLDRVDELDAGLRAAGTLLVSRNAPFLAGHFPGRPVLPGVLLVEAMAQLSGVVLWSAEPTGTDAPSAPVGGLGVLAAVKRLRFRRIIVPGEVVRIDTELTARLGGVSEFKVSARVGRALAADGALDIGFHD
ncbi:MULTISPECIES: 3-hydroxyacyl-ACP dehydratase FabZ [unclassified Streptomyces]|uniref:3-hydroxyacyl-ACP dehydratase FabZ n=1 Tax=unclassified Streptomyces TaxID=2593676 RepID=UPI0013691B8A|nr:MULTISPECIES: 3-hydroxyacyl-ACP dehydratase FabZ [unclassified Streptomyces]MYS21711.1 3-hydroxyacyl-ACP dehydratase FabZ [Streptomyces sp. SID4948]